MGKRLYIETWGCQMNLHQSEGLAGVMTQAGYTLVDRLDWADVVLFNGCMVRQKAEEKVYGRIGAVVEEKRKRDVTLGVGGCLGQVRGDSLLERFSAIDFVFGAGGHGSVPDLVDRVRDTSSRVVECGRTTTVDELPYVRRNPVTAMVTIAEGCSNCCSYCVVPHARGTMRSRSPELVLREVEAALECGALEVVLLGQNVNAYGADRREFGGFAALLARVAGTGIPRVRFTTSHPRDMTHDVLDVMASTPNVCNHLHLPAQSGSDRILAAMHRGYSAERYAEVVRVARERIAGVNVTTDLIVGYPGETQEDFDATMALIDAVRFGTVFAAKYSARPLTQSAEVEDDVPESVKAARLELVLARQRRIALEENERFLGREVVVLFERAARGGGCVGRAADHRTVVARDGVVGELSAVRVEGVSAAGLFGSVRGQQGTEGRR